MARIEITAMTLGPFGLGHVNGRAVMVPHSAPGDMLEVTIEAERRDYAIARIERVLRAGADRRVPPCPFVPRCGGCDWQQITYPAQLAVKAREIASELSRALGSEISSEGLIEPAPAEFGYRSRVRFQIGPGGTIGFHEAQSNRLVAIDRCLVAVDQIAIPCALADAMGRRCHAIEVVVGDDGAPALVAQLGGQPGAAEIDHARRVLADNPALRGVILRGGGVREKIGVPAVAIELEPGLSIEVEADLFSQVNRTQNRKLVAAVMATVAPAEGTPILDLFCGAGNFSLPAARRGARTIGVDADPDAVAAARRNSARLKFAGAQFIAMKATETARFLTRARYRPEIVILDPPRSGAADLIEPVIRMRPARVLYVSCNVATLARDLRRLANGGFRLGTVHAFDFFPNTHHAEVLAEMLLT